MIYVLLLFVCKRCIAWRCECSAEDFRIKNAVPFSAFCVHIFIIYVREFARTGIIRRIFIKLNRTIFKMRTINKTCHAEKEGACLILKSPGEHHPSNILYKGKIMKYTNIYY